MRRCKKIMYLLGDFKKQFYLLFFIYFDGIAFFLEGFFNLKSGKIQYLLFHRVLVVSLYLGRHTQRGRVKKHV